MSSQGAAVQNDSQKTIEGLYLSIKQRKFQLYRQTGETITAIFRYLLPRKLRILHNRFFFPPQLAVSGDISLGKRLLQKRKLWTMPLLNTTQLWGMLTNSLLLMSSWSKTTSPGLGNVSKTLSE